MGGGFHTPIGTRNQNPVPKVAEVVEERVEAACCAGSGGEVGGLYGDVRVEVGVEEGGESVEEVGIAGEATWVGEMLRWQILS